MANDIGGVWRTIGGRRIFIKEGQDLASAMKESGKFKSAKKFSKREELKKDIAHQVTEAEKNGNTAHAEAGKRELERLNNEEKEQAVKDYENGKISAEEVLNKFYGQEDKMKETFEQMGYTAPTKENIDRANKKHEEFMSGLKGKDREEQKEIKGMTDKLGVEKDNPVLASAEEQLMDFASISHHLDNLDNIELEYSPKGNIHITENGKDLVTVGRDQFTPTQLAELKKAGYFKSKKTNIDNEYEYNLYKQARENPDSINPMTEWSTDWEDLDKRFKDRYEKDSQKWLTEKDSNWLKNQGHDTELEKKIKNFKPSGDIDNDERRLEDISSNYFYDEVGIYNENIDSTATKWAHDKAVELNDKNKLAKEKTLADVYSYTDKQIEEGKNPLFNRATGKDKELLAQIQEETVGLDSKNQINDLMTAEQLKGKNREEQKEINKQYLKEQNKLAKEKSKEDDNQFTMYNSQYDKEVTVKKGADGKWVDSDGNKYMGYLSKQDVKQYFKGNWKESTEKRTASEILSSQMSKTKNAKIEVANALGLKYDNDNGWKSTSQLYKEQKGKDIANIAIDSGKADKYNAFVKENYNHDDKNFSDRADIDKYAKDNNLDADALYYMTKVASESDRTKLKKKAFELYKKQHPNTKKTIYSFEDDIK